MDKKLKLNIFSTAVVLTAVFTIFIPQRSLAWFDDQETSATSTLSVSTLEFSASPANDLPAGGIAPYDNTDASTSANTSYNHRLDIAKIGSLDFNYKITLVNFDDGINDGSGLCDNLTIKDDAPGSTTTFPIKSYVLNLASYPTSSSINFTIRLISNNINLVDQTCKFDYKITAWQTDMPDASTGFSDQKIVSDTIKSDPWVIESEISGSPSESDQQDEGLTGDTAGEPADNPENQSPIVGEPVVEENPVVEPEQNEENIETGDTTGQDEVIQDNNNKGDTGGGASEGSVTV